MSATRGQGEVALLRDIKITRLAKSNTIPLLGKSSFRLLHLEDISLTIGENALLQEITAQFPRRHFAAVIGPSGCGKSTLLKVIAGLRETSSGVTRWDDRDLAEEDLQPHEIGYVPQFSIAYEFLTVRENVLAALRLRVARDAADQHERVEEILKEVGLPDIADRQVRVLSGGQRRRLALALELVTAPKLLLADEVTTGLDPKAEDEIVRLMQQIAHEDDCLVLSVTHSLRHIALYDSIVVLYEGRLIYHGPNEFLCHYFSLNNPEELYPRLTKRPASEWQQSWQKHQAAYYAAEENAYQEVARAEDEPVAEVRETPAVTKPEAEPEAVSAAVPGAFTQFWTLLARRWRVFLRDRTHLLLHLALLFGFPFLVVIFAWDGLPEIQNLSSEAPRSAVEQIVEEARFMMRASRVAGLVSGLVMFQVVLLTLMGSNNAAREIAGERLIFEKEKFAGVRPSAYVASKAAFLAVLVLAQSVWMGVFVNVICRFPGSLLTQVALLVMVNAAMTAVCLGVSALMRSAEQASLVTVYLVGFQLPLSGAVLALPEVLAWLTRPFIAAYWSWSGFLQTMRDTRFYDMVQQVTETPLVAIPVSIWVLSSHVILGLFVAYMGCKSSRWE
jgi:ABC transport system ATP-binding/permease protein